MEYFSSMENVLWLIWLGVGVAFLVAELIVPGFILIFFGMGAIIAGATAFFGSSLQVQLVIFGVTSVVLLLVFRKVMASTFRGTSDDDDPEEEDHAIGAQAEVIEAINPPQRGRVKFQGTFWTAESSDPIGVGEAVRIISRSQSDRACFVVEKEN